MPRETLWSIAEDRLGSPFRWKEIAALNYDVPQADGGALTPDHWIRPGWSLELPPPFGHLRTSSIVRRGPATVESERDLVFGRLTAAGRTGGPIDPSAPAVPLGGGVVGAGVVGLLDRMRRVQQRHRREGTYIRLPDRDQRHFEGRLRLGEGPEIVRDVDSALRLLAGAWIGLERDAPSVMGLTVHADSIQLTVNGPIDDERIPSAFRAEPGDRTVSIPRAELPTSDPKGGARRGAIQPAPLLVTVGQGSGGLVMVNLESLGTLSVNGDAADCEGVIRALALELATSYWSGRFDLKTVGFGAELERFDRVRAVDDVSPLLDQLLSRRLRAETLLDTSNLQSFAQARNCRHVRPMGPRGRRMRSVSDRYRRCRAARSGLRSPPRNRRRCLRTSERWRSHREPVGPRSDVLSRAPRYGRPPAAGRSCRSGRDHSPAGHSDESTVGVLVRRAVFESPRADAAA